MIGRSGVFVDRIKQPVPDPASMKLRRNSHTPNVKIAILDSDRDSADHVAVLNSDPLRPFVEPLFDLTRRRRYYGKCLGRLMIDI